MSEKGVKRKKKSFLQKTMKYYKKGVHGKGIHVNDESFEYFLHVLKIMNQDFGSDEEKRDFVQNVFEQLNDHEVEYSCNQVISRITDNLLPLASDEIVVNFMIAFDDQLRLACMDPYASHVLQKLIVTVSDRYQNYCQNETSENSDLRAKFCKWLIKVAKFSLNNFEEFIFDNYANHVLRTVLCFLVGKKEETMAKSTVKEEVELPDEFREALKTFLDQLLNWPRLKELPFDNLLSGFLQVLIRCCAIVSTKRKKLLIRKIIDCCFSPETTDAAVDVKNFSGFSSIPSMFSSDSCVRLLETVISVASAKHFTQIYSRCFINRLPALACHPAGNFAVQKLIQHCEEKMEFESIFDELVISFDSILSNNRSGVILQLCEACIRHKTKQSIFMQAWMQYLGCNEPKESQILLCPLTLYMKQKDEYVANEENVISLHGSLLVQNMLKFNKPIKIISSLLEMNGCQLANVFCDQKGSHIANAFFESEFVGEKSREKLFKTLNNYYSLLAVSKHGSRVFDILWRVANTKHRTSIACELLEEEAKLSNSPFGRPIIYNLSLSTLRHSKEEWLKAQTTSQKAIKLFSDIISA